MAYELIERLNNRAKDKMFYCPACKKVNIGKQYCVKCGCYLPIVLARDEQDRRDYYIYSSPAYLTNSYAAMNSCKSQLNYLNNLINQSQYANLQSQINYLYSQQNQNAQTNFILSQI